ncbi:Dps family protein [Rheinheimera sp. MMS21-TC3]|uniref:Dps family protein n=1 Tax=Rheinheimera sp. MMS21-TC3 TaxID=3072790 RepID=UPI0028C406D0|nr:Dps family protein [Rheinheimera sp. MMS21-TC3]WNO61068.1 Dps family protein [Rheinheimera sp. MMS21-TC3]
MQVNIGITQEQRKSIAEGLAVLLADSYTLYLKTHNYHWNVTGPMFQSLHTLFEGQYQELAVAVDDIAERIRALGEFAPGSYKEFAKITTIQEAEGTPTAEEMIKDLVKGHEAIAKTSRNIVPIAGNASDEVTLDILTQRMTVHEKTAWMLRSMVTTN